MTCSQKIRPRHSFQSHLRKVESGPRSGVAERRLSLKAHCRKPSQGGHCEGATVPPTCDSDQGGCPTTRAGSTVSRLQQAVKPWGPGWGDSCSDRRGGPVGGWVPRAQNTRSGRGSGVTRATVSEPAWPGPNPTRSTASWLFPCTSSFHPRPGTLPWHPQCPAQWPAHRS